MKSILPIIVVISLLTGAIVYSLSKRAIPKTIESRFGIPANELESGSTDKTKAEASANTVINFVTPTPTAKATLTPTPAKAVVGQVAALPVIDETAITTKGGLPVVSKDTTAKVTKTTKTIVCTPVYGQANSCTEHIVVDTGAENAIFFNFAGLAYLAGLASFIKAKRA